MRLRGFSTAAVICLGTLALAACGQQAQQEVGEQSAEPETPMAGYDLSAESNARYLADNREREGVMETPSGLQYRVIVAGEGEGLSAPEDIVRVSYTGWLIDGTVFDGTDPGQTVEFAADNLIRGWVEALSMMHVGDKWELVIPTVLGYGTIGAGGIIPPDQTLVFEMELHEVTPAAVPGEQ